jgi:hypothetical protein
MECMLLARVFALDVTRCPACGGRRRLIAALTDPASIRRYLHGGELPTQPPTAHRLKTRPPFNSLHRKPPFAPGGPSVVVRWLTTPKKGGAQRRAPGGKLTEHTTKSLETKPITVFIVPKHKVVQSLYATLRQKCNIHVPTDPYLRDFCLCYFRFPI